MDGTGFRIICNFLMSSVIYPIVWQFKVLHASPQSPGATTASIVLYMFCLVAFYAVQLFCKEGKSLNFDIKVVAYSILSAITCVAGFLGVFSLLLHGDAPLMSPAVVDGTGNPVELNYDQDERGYVAIVSVGLTMVAVAVYMIFICDNALATEEMAPKTKHFVMNSGLTLKPKKREGRRARDQEEVHQWPNWSENLVARNPTSRVNVADYERPSYEHRDMYIPQSHKASSVTRPSPAYKPDMARGPSPGLPPYRNKEDFEEIALV